MVLRNKALAFSAVLIVLGLIGAREWRQKAREAALNLAMERLSRQVEQREEQARERARAAGVRDFSTEIEYARALSAREHARNEERDAGGGPLGIDEEPAPEREPAGPSPEARVGAELARIGEEFTAERVDSAWSYEARTSLERHLRTSTDAGARDLSIECRASLCKVEAAHDDEKDRVAFVTAALRPDAWRGEAIGLRASRPDGRVTSVLYFAKEGRAFYPSAPR